MRIAVLDNTCNTAYVTTKLLRRAGHAAEFIEEPNTPFNHQPVWEDADLTLPAADVAFAPRGDRYWRRIERELGWDPPPWIRRPRWRPADIVRSLTLTAKLAGTMPPLLIPFGEAAMAGEVPLISALAGYDFALVLGPSAPIGLLSGTPYAVITMGWEIATLPFLTEARSPFHRARAWLQRAALARSQRILGMPSTDLPFLRRLGLELLLEPFPVPVDIDDYEAIEPGTRESVMGDDIARRTAGRIVYFHPSRIYFPIKGTDILLRAFAKVLEAGVPGSLILLAWGDDVAAARALIRELGLEETVHLLPWVMSKKRLIRMLDLIDVAVIQLVPPGYSTLDREALACGKPVVSSYDPNVPQPHPPADPAPILSARSVDETRDAMVRLADPALRDRIGAEGRRWVRRNHYDAAMASLERVLSGA